MSTDPRANSQNRLVAPAPLPYVSRKALKRVKHATPIPHACHHCHGPVRLVENSEIYNGRTYGDWPYAYLCQNNDCRAYVGLHPDTDLPLGTLADKATRDARNKAKKPFNSIWQSGYMSRTEAYSWLAENLGMEVSECHFGLMNIGQCERAYIACSNLTPSPDGR